MSGLAAVKKISPNTSVVFRTPIECEDTLVRTGCSSESSSFFHCVLHSYWQKYNVMKDEERMKLVRRFRASLAGKIDRKTWEEMDGGFIAKTAFKENISDIILNCYRFFKDDPKARGSATHRVIKNLVGEDEKLFESYKLITELIPLTEGFEEKIMSVAYDESEGQKMSMLNEAIIKNADSYVKKRKDVKSVSQDKSKHIRGLVSKFLTAVMKEAEEEAFKSFVAGSENLPEDVDTYTISVISKKFNRDIYMIDGKNRMPFLNPQTVDNIKGEKGGKGEKGRKSILILCIDKGHYEILGKLLPNNSIQREFEQSDPIIRKIYTFLVNPEKVSEECNDLVKYLPEQYQNSDSSSESSGSEEESEEEEESD